MGSICFFCACVQTPIRLRESAEAASAEELRTDAAVQEMIHGPPTQSGPRPDPDGILRTLTAGVNDYLHI